MDKDHPAFEDNESRAGGRKLYRHAKPRLILIENGEAMRSRANRAATYQRAGSRCARALTGARRARRERVLTMTTRSSR